MLLATPYFFRWNKTGETVVGVTNSPSNSMSNLNTPGRICIDQSDILYISDTNNNRIQAYVINSTIITTVAGSFNGSSGTGMDRLNYPTDVQVDSAGNLYIADSNNHRIQLWNASATSGMMILGTGLLSQFILLIKNFDIILY